MFKISQNMVTIMHSLIHSVEPETILLWLHVHLKIERHIKSHRHIHRYKIDRQNFPYILPCFNFKAGVMAMRLLLGLEVVRVADDQSHESLQYETKGHRAGVGAPAGQWCCRGAGFCVGC